MSNYYRADRYDYLAIRRDPNVFTLHEDGLDFIIKTTSPDIGSTSIEIKLHYCNLKCSYCPVKDTWDTKSKNYYFNFEKLDIVDFANRLMFFRNDCSRLIFSGGEPMIQQDVIKRFLHAYPRYFAEIETNGTIAPDPYLLKLKELGRVEFNVSPKLLASGNNVKDSYKPEVLKIFDSCDSIFTFIINDISDIEEIEHIYISRGNISKKNIQIDLDCYTYSEYKKLKKQLYPKLNSVGLKLAEVSEDAFYPEVKNKKEGMKLLAY